MKKIYFILPILIIVLLIFLNFSKSKNNVLIYSDGNLIYKIDLEHEETKDIKISAQSGYNIVHIENNEIYVKDATCKDKVCKNHGVLKNKLNPIVCLPNKLVITFED